LCFIPSGTSRGMDLKGVMISRGPDCIVLFVK
jgi:hypothetical protein